MSLVSPICRLSEALGGSKSKYHFLKHQWCVEPNKFSCYFQYCWAVRITEYVLPVISAVLNPLIAYSLGVYQGKELSIESTQATLSMRG